MHISKIIVELVFHLFCTDYFFYLGLVLFESTQPTPNDNEKLVFLLNKVRKLQFPDSFVEERRENILIKKMLSTSPEGRPTAHEIFDTIRDLTKNDTEGKICKSLALITSIFSY